MMPVFLAGVNFIVLLMLGVSAYLGFGELTTDAVFNHMYWGVATSFLGLFGHSFTMFFFIGTGKAIKEACKDHKPAWPLIGRSNGYKALIAGRTMIASTMLIIQPVLGAAVYSGRLSPHVHQFGFWVTLLVHGWVFYTELKYLGLNNVLMNDVAKYKETGLLPESLRPPE
jgi:hypothetical protein